MRRMKNAFYYMTALLSLGMLIASCNKEADVTVPEETNAKTEVKPVEMAFTATIEAKNSTKSVDASGATAWVENEEIHVYYEQEGGGHASATARVTSVVAGFATIEATLTSAVNNSEVKFVYPATLGENGEISLTTLSSQDGTISGISTRFDAATATSTLVTNGTTCGTAANIHMDNQVLIGKFIPKLSGTAINAIKTLIISDGTHTYTVTAATTFDTEGIYVAMLPFNKKLVTITAEVDSDHRYAFYKADITLEAGKIYTNFAIPMMPATFVDNKTADILRTTLNSAATGSAIVMAKGTYLESNSNYIAFSGKDVTVLAAPGASVTLQQQVPITITSSGKATFVGIAFDASHLNDIQTWYEHIIYPEDDTNNSLVLEHCDITNFNINKSAIYCSSSNKYASVSFSNCYFHGIKKSVFFSEGAVGSFSMKNSTVANISTVTDSYWAGIIDLRNTSSVVDIDHCTFYNCQVMTTDYGAIKTTSAKTTVSNCIFMMPASTDNLRTIHGQSGSSAKNCYVFNYKYDSGYGIRSDVSKTSCTKDVDPLFVNAASGDFHLSSSSPALTASDTGGPIGDPLNWK